MEDGQLHKVMTGCGYRYTRARNLPEKSLLHSRGRGKGFYTKEYATEAGNFIVALVIRSDPFTELPIAIIIEQPEQFQNCLMPHMSQEGILCYVDQMEADWDSNDLAGTYKEVDVQIRLTLINSVSAATTGLNDKREMEGEFAAYWQPSETLFLLSNASRGSRLKTSLAKSILSEGTTRQEYITDEVSSSEDSEIVITKWLKQRYFPRNSLKKTSISTHYISVNPSRLAGMKWPPASFRDLLEWLEKSDHNARDRVIEHIKAEGKKRYIFLFDVLNQDIFAIYVEFNMQSVDFRRHKKSAKKSAKKSTVKLATMLGGKNVCTEYQRLDVIRADIATLLSRNARREGKISLSEKRIALIGCGTIGGYLAELLFRNGAGYGKGLLHIYDGDIYNPSNFGRHTLSSRDFGFYKSISLATRLKDSLHLQTNIVGFNEHFLISTVVMQNYDIIIDATGRPPVSKRIASVVRKIPLEKRPFIIHAFNDGNGRASKVFIDDGRCCYGCMICNPEKYHNGTDSRFISLDMSSEMNKSCGSTYTLYDAAVSNITASLAQMAVLSTLEPELKWTYNEHVLDGGRSFKPQFLPHQPNCTVCNEHK